MLMVCRGNGLQRHQLERVTRVLTVRKGEKTVRKGEKTNVCYRLDNLCDEKLLRKQSLVTLSPVPVGTIKDSCDQQV